MSFPKKIKFGDKNARLVLDHKSATLTIGSGCGYDAMKCLNFKNSKEIDCAIDDLLKVKWYLQKIGYFK